MAAAVVKGALGVAALFGLFGLVSATEEVTDNVARGLKWAAVGGAVYVAGKALKVI